MVFRPNDRIAASVGVRSAPFMILGDTTFPRPRYLWWNFVACIEEAKAEWCPRTGAMDTLTPPTSLSPDASEATANLSDILVDSEISGFGTELVLPELANDQPPLAPCLSIGTAYPKQFPQDCYEAKAASYALTWQQPKAGS